MIFTRVSPTVRAESVRMCPRPCSQPMVGVPRKMTNVLTARASVAAGPANPVLIRPMTVPAMSPVPALAIIANLIAAARSASERARASDWASTQGTDTVATVAAHSSRPWPAPNLVYASTLSSRVSTSA